jgi:hypothetical protein
VLATEDGLGFSPNGVAAAKTVTTQFCNPSKNLVGLWFVNFGANKKLLFI